MQPRLLSLDVFRGMTVFFMIVVNTPGSWKYVYAPLLHAKWDGCTPTDLVFPFFMCIVGVSMAISYQKFKELDHSVWRKKVVIRGIKIILIGLLLNWFPFYTKHISEVRVYGVLPRIGLSFLLTGLLITFVKEKYLWTLMAFILVAYYIILSLNGDGALTLEGNLVSQIDLYLFGPHHIYKGYGVPFDPEGLLSTLPALATVLIGYLAGISILNITKNISKVYWLLSVGALLISLGLAWSYLGFPLNKPLWSSSYVLFTGGMALGSIGLLIYLIDIKGIQKWTYIFNAFGKNPLVCFVLSGLVVKTSLLLKIGDLNLYQYTYTTFYQTHFGDYLGSLLFALSVVMLIWLIAWWMDRRGIIIKV